MSSCPCVRPLARGGSARALRPVLRAFMARALKKAAASGFCLIIGLSVGCSSGSAARVNWELSDSAQRTYATLLLDQSIRNNIPEGVLEAAEIFLSLGHGTDSVVEAAAWLLTRNQPALARPLLEKAARTMPDNTNLHLLLAESWLAEGATEKAVSVMLDYVGSHPDADAARQEIGLLLLKSGRHADAVRHFESLPARLRTPSIRFAHANALLLLKRPAEAAVELEKAGRAAPAFVEIWLELGRAYELMNQPTRAVTAYERALEQDPGHQDAWLRLINLELRSGRPQKALELVRSGPASYGLLLTVATLFVDEGHYQDAESLLLPLTEEPDVPEEVWFTLAAIAFDQRKDLPGALEMLTHISPQSRSYDRALQLRTRILFEQGELDKALHEARQGVRAFPADRDFRLMEIHLLLAAKRHAEALVSVDLALNILPGDAEILFMRGMLLDTLKRRDEALVAMEALLAAHPENYQALNYIGYTLADENRDLPRALELLHRADKLAPNRAYILDSLAWALFRSGEVNKAWDTIRRSVAAKDGATEPAIWDHYGDIAAALGLKDEARKGWTRALELNPEDPQPIRNKVEKP